MLIGQDQARFESALATAHRSIWRCATYAESQRDQGLADDLYALAGEIGRIHLSQFGSRARGRPSNLGGGARPA